MREIKVIRLLGYLSLATAAVMLLVQFADVFTTFTLDETHRGTSGGMFGILCILGLALDQIASALRRLDTDVDRVYEATPEPGEGKG